MPQHFVLVHHRQLVSSSTSRTPARSAGIASPVEYDIPQTEGGIHTITGTFDVAEAKGGKMKLAAAHLYVAGRLSPALVRPPHSPPRLIPTPSCDSHCHAPACLEVTMYNNATGEVICSEKPVYGGTGKIHEPRFDEEGYIAQPPCLWGDAEFGLEAPYHVGGQTLHVMKHSNATYTHRLDDRHVEWPMIPIPSQRNPPPPSPPPPPRNVAARWPGCRCFTL